MNDESNDAGHLGHEGSGADGAPARRFPAIAFAVACMTGIAAGAWSYGAVRAAMDVAAGESPVAMAGRENAMGAFHRSSYRLWLKLALEPSDLELKEKYVRREDPQQQSAGSPDGR